MRPWAPVELVSHEAIEDVLGGIYPLMAATESEGPVDLRSPHPVRTHAFAETLAEVLGRTDRPPR